ncbi:MAG TPA: transposase [Bryobacteraceae bacterium]|jgi:REP element-mobilizing transposase RayT|nr:transposase [Bryobacteraceae bacterium]
MQPVPEQNRDRKGAATYLLTWACYGSWLTGQPGAVSQTRNQYGAPLPEPDSHIESHSKNRMTQEPYVLDPRRRQVILQSLRDTCRCRSWILWAAHVRTNHVHVVITANTKPEQMMNALKAHSSRALNQLAQNRSTRRRWVRHGSTGYLWTDNAVRAAIQYVVHEQGVPMAVFERPLSEPGRPQGTLGSGYTLTL